MIVLEFACDSLSLTVEQKQAKEKGELGRKAIAAQSGYMAKAVEGKGCDRHLLGIFSLSFRFA